LGASGGSCSCTTEDFLNEFGCSGEQPSSFILHDRNFERIRQRRSAAGGSCSRTTEDFLNEFGCSGEQPSSFILHDRKFERIRQRRSAAGGSCSCTTEAAVQSTALQRPQFFGLPTCRFHDLPISSARQEPRPPITLTHYALRITLTSFPFLSWHNCDEHENGAKCDVRCWVRCAECGVKLMGFCSSNLRAKERA
jgi:hypothetical protein